MHKTIQAGFVILALSAGFYVADYVAMPPQQPSQSELTDYCLLSIKSCEQNGISMALDDNTVRPLTATPLRVDWPDTSADRLMLKLEGKEMDMGEVRFVLQRNAQGVFTANITLPVCTADSMTWRGSLTDGTQTVYPAIRMQR